MLAQFSPVNKYAWLGPGHTLPCDSWQNSNHRMALLQYAHPGTARIALEQFLGDPVNVLWFVPISEVFHRPSRPAADETLLDCLGVVGTKVGVSLVQSSPF